MAATPTSAWSVKRPSMPVSRKVTCSSRARPNAVGSAPVRSSAGRNVFSARKVHGWTLSPAAWASATRLGRAAQGPVAVARDDERLLGADAVDRLAELEEAVRLDEVAVGARVALRDEVVGRSAGHQEDERRADPVLVAQLEEVGQLERLDEDRRVPPVEVVPAHGVGDLGLEVEAGLVEECRVLRLRVDADRLAAAPWLSRSRSSRTSSKVGTSNLSSHMVLSCRTCGRRSLARSVFSSARVKSVVNHPVTGRPSMDFVVRREANSGRSATSVVSEISGSWRATRTPSLVETRSGSMKSAPMRAASSYAAKVCSGR